MFTAGIQSAALVGLLLRAIFAVYSTMVRTVRDLLVDIFDGVTDRYRTASGPNRRSGALGNGMKAGDQRDECVAPGDEHFPDVVPDPGASDTLQLTDSPVEGPDAYPLASGPFF